MRVEAALTLRALAEIDPTCIGGLISYAVTMLGAIRENISFEKVKPRHIYSAQFSSLFWLYLLGLNLSVPLVVMMCISVQHFYPIAPNCISWWK